jgi:hypothetical protein
MLGKFLGKQWIELNFALWSWSSFVETHFYFLGSLRARSIRGSEHPFDHAFTRGGRIAGLSLCPFGKLSAFIVGPMGLRASKNSVKGPFDDSLDGRFELDGDKRAHGNADSH